MATSSGSAKQSAQAVPPTRRRRSATIGNAAGSGSMTCAGIASIWITSEHIGTPDARAAAETVSCCGGGSSPKVLERGLQWLGRRFSVVENPGTGGQTWRTTVPLVVSELGDRRHRRVRVTGAFR